MRLQVSYSEWPETGKCFITIALQLRFGIRLRNQEGLKLNGTQQLFAYADDVNIVEEKKDNMNKNIEGLLDALKKVGLEMSPEKVSIC
jgi:hypothetical protein